MHFGAEKSVSATNSRVISILYALSDRAAGSGIWHAQTRLAAEFDRPPVYC
jgi:hypothetical protein